ncbi:MAG TPA: DUF1385 domain-containing protein [Candidatus Limnocylindrales bacterium]|nr:DUF1385 domain-containing protein [Candidatus Limnocylindrales bacterium]
MARVDYGGQALLEGVLIRGRNAIGVALRHPDGSIVATAESLNSILHRNRFARAPFFRGLIVLYEMLVIGTRWLMRSGQVQARAAGEEMGRGAIALTLLLTLGLAIGLFVLLPLLIATFTTRATVGADQTLIEHLLEGLIRVVVFVGYLLLVSQSGEIRRVFRYHGAEHMTIHAFEHGDPLTVQNVRRYPTAHQRCGTEFLVVFIILSILLFSMLAGQDLLISIVGRLALLPVIASIAYEILRFGARHRHRWWIRWLFMPGIWLQAITTKQPDDDMIEVAIASMREALAANGDPAPEGSIDPVRRPIPEAEERPASRPVEGTGLEPGSEPSGSADSLAQ